MYIYNGLIFTIMIIGCWSSDALLVYIFRKIISFTQSCTVCAAYSARRSSDLIVHCMGLTIMIIGCWSFDALLVYICRKIISFTQGISSQILATNIWFNTNDTNTQSSPSEDPRIPNSRHRLPETSQYNTLVSLQVTPPSLHL